MNDFNFTLEKKSLKIVQKLISPNLTYYQKYMVHAD